MMDGGFPSHIFAGSDSVKVSTSATLTLLHQPGHCWWVAGGFVKMIEKTPVLTVQCNSCHQSVTYNELYQFHLWGHHQ